MEELKYVDISEIIPNPYQPRIHFEEEKLEELAQSIRVNGLIQPLIVRKSDIIGYELLETFGLNVCLKNNWKQLQTI